MVGAPLSNIITLPSVSLSLSLSCFICLSRAHVGISKNNMDITATFLPIFAPSFSVSASNHHIHSITARQILVIMVLTGMATRGGARAGSGQVEAVDNYVK